MKCLFVLSFFLCPVLLQAQDNCNIREIDACRLMDRRDIENPVLIDGRSPEMFNPGQIETAININAFSGEAPSYSEKCLTKKKLTVYFPDTTRSEELIRLKPIVQVFGTASYNAGNNHFGYSFGRAHIGVQHQFNPKWSAKVIIDRGRATSVGDISVTDSLGNQLNAINTSQEGACYTMFLKFASLQWKVNNKLTLEGGAILQNHYITQERFWGFRYIARTFQDLYWEIPSSDLGFIAYYKINDAVSVDAAITNGEGPRVRQDKFGKVKFAGGLDINPSQKVQTRIYYHNRQSGVDGEATEQLLSVFTGYKPTNRFRMGGEFNYMNNLDNISGLKSYGFSACSAYQFVENTQVFLRYDRLLFESGNAAPDIQGNGNTFMGGISYSPVKGVNVSLNYQGWLAGATINQSENSLLLSMEYKF